MNCCPLCKENHAECLLELPPYTLLKCQRCSFVWVIPRLTPSDLIAVYNEAYFTGQGPFGYRPLEDYLGDEARLGIFIERIARIERYRKPPGFMVDVGCGNGFSLRVARDHGWDCLGMDISEFAVNHVRERYGQNVFRGTLREAALPNESADVLTMWDVIEHLLDPWEECIEANRIMKSKGVLALSTPDADAPNPSPESCDPAKIPFWQANPPEHLQYFSPTSISRLLAETGFQIVELISFGPDDRRLGAMEVYAVKTRDQGSTTTTLPSQIP